MACCSSPALPAQLTHRRLRHRPRNRATPACWLPPRANLVFSLSWNTVRGSPIGPLLGSWAAWLGGRGLGDDSLRVGGLYALLDSGKLADFACFAEDPMRVELDRLKDLAPEFAVVGGRTVWERTGRNIAQRP